MRTKRRMSASSSTTSTETRAFAHDARGFLDLRDHHRRRLAARQRDREARAAAVARAAFDRAAVRLDDRAADRQPRGRRLRRRFFLAALELAEDRLLAAAGRPGPWSSSQTSIVSLVARAPMSIAAPLGVYLAAFSSRLASTRSNRLASMRTSGRSAGSATRTGCLLSAGPSDWIALPTTSSSGCHSKRGRTSPASRRAMSSRFVDQRIHAQRGVAQRLRDLAPARPWAAAWSAPAHRPCRPATPAACADRARAPTSSELRSRSDSICTVLLCATSM